jgi:hypothetical protein
MEAFEARTVVHRADLELEADRIRARLDVAVEVEVERAGPRRLLEKMSRPCSDSGRVDREPQRSAPAPADSIGAHPSIVAGRSRASIP